MNVRDQECNRGVMFPTIAAAVGIWCSSSQAAVIRVPQDAPTIQAGIDLAMSGDTVLVSCGTYSEALSLKDGVTVRSETGFPDCVTLDVAAGTAACTAIGDQGVVLEGLRFTTTASPARGLIAQASSEITVRRCEYLGLETQSAGPSQPGGPAIRLFQSQVAVEECLFADNAHTGVGNRGGGAISCDSSNVSIAGSTFLRNTAISGGGALECRYSTLEVTGSEFRENRAFPGGIGIGEGNGGAIFYDAALSPLTFTLSDCALEMNSCGGFGGAVLASTIHLIGSQLTGNEAEDGGGAWVFNGTIEGCEFLENRGEQGTALFVVAGTFIRETLFARNACLGTPCDGTVRSDGASFLQCTFVDNHLVGPGAAEIASFEPNLVVLNTIIAFSDGGIPVSFNDPNANPLVQCSDFYGNSGGDWVGEVAGLEGVAGNISQDPLFCGARQHEYGLHSNSPCAPPNSGSCGLIGAIGVECTPVHVEAATWGAIKALHR